MFVGLFNSVMEEIRQYRIKQQTVPEKLEQLREILYDVIDSTVNKTSTIKNAQDTKRI